MRPNWCAAELRFPCHSHSTALGYSLQWTGSYKVPFLIAGSSYLVALGLIQLLSPRLEPAILDRD